MPLSEHSPFVKELRRKPQLIHDEAAAVANGKLIPFDGAADVAVIQVDGGGAFATNTLTFVAQPADGETVSIGLQTWTFRAAITSLSPANEVLLGATLAITVTNLIAAWMNQAGRGVLYSNDTEASVEVSSLQGAGTTIDVQALARGTPHNAVTTTDTMANGGNIWTTATLLGGTEFVATVDFLGTTDGVNRIGLSAVPLEGGAAVITTTARGTFRVDCAGLTGIVVPVSAYTSGVVNVRFFHRSKSQG